ncbi:MAG TPA: hypothetical protein VGH24_03560 [Solirubrobacteraceae bacterium]
MHGRGLLAAVVVAIGSFVAPASAAADPSVTITPPSGPAVHAFPDDLRTTERQPTFAIVGTDGSQLSCNLDNQASGGEFVFGPCGSAPPSCAGSVCANFQPSAPLASGYHSLAVEMDGPDGSAQANVSFEVDLTPPDTVFDTQQGSVLRPSFNFIIHEDDQFDRSDSGQCSLTRLGSPAAWQPCGSSLRGGDEPTFRSPAKLPDRHVDYRFQARGVDDFGRPDPTPATFDFDPVPCAVTARSISIGKLISTGIPVTLACSFTHRVVLDFFFLGKNGQRTTIGVATNNYPNLGYQQVRSGKARFTVHRTLRMFADNDPYFRMYRSAALVIRASPESTGNVLPAYSVITVRR